jgi:hypothetical protein
VTLLRYKDARLLDFSPSVRALIPVPTSATAQLSTSFPKSGVQSDSAVSCYLLDPAPFKTQVKQPPDWGSVSHTSPQQPRDILLTTGSPVISITTHLDAYVLKSNAQLIQKSSTPLLRASYSFRNNNSFRRHHVPCTVLGIKNKVTIAKSLPSWS